MAASKKWRMKFEVSVSSTQHEPVRFDEWVGSSLQRINVVLKPGVLVSLTFEVMKKSLQESQDVPNLHT